MSYCGVSIFSDNLSGQTAIVTFLPCSGGTINLGDQTFPFTYYTDYWYGTYECYVPTYAYTYTIDVPCPSPTPTPTPTTTPGVTPTPTETSTPTLTPTNTDTPTNTPSETPTETPTQTQTLTPTQTPTLTQTPTSINYQFELGYGFTPNDACSSTETSFYGTRSGGPTLEVSETLYINSGVTSPAPDGYYSDGVILYIVSGGLGEITSKYNNGCVNLATPTPTVTETSTPTPTVS